MYKSIKVLHIIGVVLFFGSILGHAIAGVVLSDNDSPQTLSIVRQVIQVETTYLTLPGLILFTITGIGMIIVGKLPIKELRWLAIHITLGSFVALNAFFVLIPVGQEILDISNKLMSDGATLEHLKQLGNKEAIFGAFNIIACLLLIIVAVFKPKFGSQ